MVFDGAFVAVALRPIFHFSGTPLSTGRVSVFNWSLVGFQLAG
jgi:hypothetical protein